MNFLGFINSLLATYSIFQLAQLAGIVIVLGFSAVCAFWAIIKGVTFLVTKSRIKKLGPVTFDPDEPAPKKRRVFHRKAVK